MLIEGRGTSAGKPPPPIGTPPPGMKGGTPGQGVAPQYAPPPAVHTRADLTIPCVRVGCPHRMTRTTVRECDAAGTSYDMPGWRCVCGVETVEGRRR